MVPASLASRVIRRVHHGVSVLANKARKGRRIGMEVVEDLASGGVNLAIENGHLWWILMVNTS